MNNRLKSSFPIALLIGLILLFFYRLAFTNLILARGDVFLYFYPYWHAASQALHAGKIPLWNPDLFMGAPFLANSQVGFFYPLNWLVWLLLDTPYAFKLSILIHVTIAGIGTYLAARHTLQLRPSSALLSAILFALGGYFTAQVEHINQVQALAWLPWFLPALSQKPIPRRLLCLSALFTLQLLAGHTQSTFITGIGAGIWLLCTTSWNPFQNPKSKIQNLLVLASSALIAALLATIQLLPTLELTTLSSRSGGLAPAEVLAFSWHPLLIPRALLPSLDTTLFTEYVAFLPLITWLLIIIAFTTCHEKHKPYKFALIALMLAGIFLALGQFNPFNWQLAKLPGFDLFRVPARWLILYSLGIALFAGIGLDTWQDSPTPNRNTLLITTGVILLLIVSTFISVPLARLFPLSPEVSAVLPNFPTITLWIVEIAGILFLLYRPKPTPLAPFVITLSLVVLFFASRTQPYHRNTTTPEAYFDLRPAPARLQAFTQCLVPNVPCPHPPGRVLSLSHNFFDPGDLGEINTIYAGILDETAWFDYVVAIKQKEILVPNLPLQMGLPSVDGFDGGILPLKSYSDMTQLILPDGVTTTDGRLREHLPAIPSAPWLDLFNVQYLITDRIGDDWREGAFFDLHHPITLTPHQATTVGYIPDFPATQLWLWADGTQGTVTLDFAGNPPQTLTPELFTADLVKVSWAMSATVTAITLTATTTNWTVHGMTLVDERDHTFRDLIPGQYRAIYSGDVKIYENLDVLPRAFLVTNWQWQPDRTATLVAMRQPTFNPHQEAVLMGTGEPVRHSVSPQELNATITSYIPEQITLDVSTPQDALLILTEAHYPGWQATIDDTPTDIFIANGMFQALKMPAGSHQVTFTFTSPTFQTGRLITLITLALWLFFAGWSIWPHKQNASLL